MILPINLKWQFTWPSSTNLFSILATFDSGYDWLMNHFTLLFCDSNICNTVAPVNASIPRPNAFRDWQLCEVLDYQKINLDNLKYYSINIIEFLKNQLKEGRYVYLLLDHSIISDYTWIDESSKYHKSLIYGYSDELNEFYLADNFRETKYKYSTKKVNTCKLKNAILSVTSNKELPKEYEWLDDCYNNVILIKRKLEYKYKYNIDLLIEYLKNHIESECTFKIWDDFREYRYGIEIYDAVVKYLYDITTEKCFILDKRIFTMIRDHKILMRDRVAYLHKENLLSDKLADDLVKDYSKLVYLTTLSLNMFIRYLVEEKKIVLHRLIEKIKLIKKCDLYASMRLVEGINNIQNNGN